MAITVYKKTLITSGVAAALDSIDGDLLLDGDYAFVTVSNVNYIYILDDDLGGAESSPTLIKPDTNPGNKIWVLQNQSLSVLTGAGDIPYASAAAVPARLAAGATTKILVGGGAAAPVWTEATGTGAPVRAGVPSFSTGIGIGGTAAGTGGVAFPASAVAVADANTLDDYEEGTWTPVYYGSAGSAGAIAYSTQSGIYTKIGRVVIVKMHIVLTNNGDWTADTVISGLPFTPVGIFYVGMYSSNVTFANQLVASAQDVGAPVILLWNVTSGGAAARLQCTAVPDNGELAVSLAYSI